MGRAVFPPCCLTWGQTLVGVMKIMETSFKKSHVLTATLSAPDPAAGHYRPTPPNRFLDTHRQVWISLLWGHAPFSWVLVHTRPSRTNSQKRCPFHYMGLECKSRKSRDTLSNRQIWPWSTKWNRAKVNSILPRECTGHSKHPLPTTQEKILYMDINVWSIDGQYRNQIDYILCSQRWRSSIQSAKTRLRADCGWDHELLIAKFRLKLKKVRKTIGPFRYDLNQIPYDYTV